MSGIATPTKDGKVFPDFDDVLPRISSDQNCFQLVRCCKITIVPLFYQWKQPTISQICHDFSNLSIRFLLGDIPGSQKAPGGPRGPQGVPGCTSSASAAWPPPTRRRWAWHWRTRHSGRRCSACGQRSAALRQRSGGVGGGFAENDGKMMGKLVFTGKKNHGNIDEYYSIPVDMNHPHSMVTIMWKFQD